jgi:hypothetical protein
LMIKKEKQTKKNLVFIQRLVVMKMKVMSVKMNNKIKERNNLRKELKKRKE